MEIQILAVPYDSGNYRARMGAGPEALLDAGLEDALRSRGHGVHTKIAELPQGAWTAEIQTSFELMRMLADAVRDAVALNRLPVVLAGNCNTAVGTVAGLGGSPAVAWFDAHADFNTPETTASGFLDGTAVAMLTGRCWTQLTSTVPAFTPVSDHALCLLGTRDIDSLEGGLLDQSSVDVIDTRSLREKLPPTLRRLAEHADRIYLHLDLDVLDSSVARANSYAVAGGLTAEDVEYAFGELGRVLPIGAVTVSAYDPSGDTGGAAAAAAIRLICAAAGFAERP